jgi:hypothetical protein
MALVVRGVHRPLGLCVLFAFCALPLRLWFGFSKVLCALRVKNRGLPRLRSHSVARPQSPVLYGILITSNAVDGTLASAESSSSLQRESGAPLTNQPEPLSATNMP